MEEDGRMFAYENLVMGRIDKMFEAKELGNGELFDELIDEIEMLFRMVPELRQEYIKVKAELDKDIQMAKTQTKALINAIEDPIIRDITTEQKKQTIEWEYRSDILESILTILDTYQMVPFINPPTGELDDEGEMPIFDSSNPPEELDEDVADFEEEPEENIPPAQPTQPTQPAQQPIQPQPIPPTQTPAPANPPTPVPAPVEQPRTPPAPIPSVKTKKHLRLKRKTQ